MFADENGSTTSVTGWIDYLLPQLYWENGHRAADYNELINWWSKHAYGRNMYAEASCMTADILNSLTIRQYALKFLVLPEWQTVLSR